MDGSTSIPIAAIGLEALTHHVTALRRLARQALAARYAYVDPDDVVQDVIVRVVRRWPLLRFADERALAGYLQRAVINRARDAQRQAPRWVDVELDGMHSPRPSALEVMMAAECRCRSASALRQLRASDRRVVVGRVLQSLSYQDLARLSGHATPDAARKATGRALVRLRQRLE